MASSRALLDTLAALFVATSGATRSARSSVHGSHGGPALDPTVDNSHGHFFTHDYPRDFNPSAGKLDNRFDHPYPAVLDTDDYERDFVKDENSDNGEWKAQHDYDTLRSKLDKLAAEVRRAEDRKRALERQLDALKAKKKTLDDMSKELEARRVQAEEVKKEEVRTAEENYRKLNSSYEGGKGHVGVADKRKEVSGDITKLEECEKELQDAQAKLKQLQKERLQAQKDLKTATAKETNAMSLEFAKQKAESQFEEEVDREAAVHDKALAKYKKEEAELMSFADRLAKAEAKLHSFRRTEVDQGGGVYRAKSGTFLPRPLLLAVSAVLAALTAGM